MIPSTFNWCVDILNWLAAHIGMTYEEVNVWIFCVIWPLITVVLIGVVIVQRMQLRGQETVATVSRHANN